MKNKNRFKHLNKNPENPKFWVAEGELHSVSHVIPELYSDNLAKPQGEHVFYFVYWKSYSSNKWFDKQVKCYNKEEAKSVYKYVKKLSNCADLQLFAQKEIYKKIDWIK